MPLTEDQIEHSTEFHYLSDDAPLNVRVAMRGKCEKWRRNGNTKRWKKSPERFRIPIKHGLYDYGYLTEDNQHLMHAAEDCANPLMKGEM